MLQISRKKFRPIKKWTSLKHFGASKKRRVAKKIATAGVSGMGLSGAVVLACSRCAETVTQLKVTPEVQCLSLQNLQKLVCDDRKMR